jgi:flagellin-like protein
VLLIVLWLIGALVVGFIATAAIAEHLGWAIIALSISPLIALLVLVAVTVVGRRLAQSTVSKVDPLPAMTRIGNSEPEQYY